MVTALIKKAGNAALYKFDKDYDSNPRKTTYYYLLISAAIGHLLHLVFFVYLELRPLVLWNLFSVVLAIGLLVVIKIGEQSLAFIMISIELITYVIVAYSFAGWEFGYQYAVFALTATAYVNPFRDPRKSRNIAFLQAVLFIGLAIFEVLYGKPNPLVADYLILFRVATTIHCVAFTIGIVMCIDMMKIEYAFNEYRLLKENRRLSTKVNYDALTGLLTRRGLIERLEQVHYQSLEKRLSYAILFVDVDNFKQINDNYGHKAGDEVIKLVVKSFREVIRERDFVGRWGGEEFVIGLVETPLEEAVAIAERIRRSVERRCVNLFQDFANVTITIGVEINNPHLSYDQVIQKADEAMYQGKQNGKNQVFVGF